jgi:hypothetical protein
MKILQSICDYGKEHLTHEEYHNSLIFSNWFTLILIPVCLGCTAMSYSLSEELIQLSWLFTFLNATPLIFNGLGLFFVSRYVLSISPSLYVAILNLSITPTDERATAAVLFMQLAMLAVPWMMFRFNEKSGLIITMLANFVMIICSVYLPGMNGDTFKDNIYFTGIGYDLGLAVAALCTLIVMAISGYLQYQKDEQTKSLLLSVKTKNQELEKGQKQLQEYIAQVEEAQKTEKRRQWIIEQINKVSEVIRSKNNLKTIYDQLIGTIVKALKANQGGLYVLTEEHQQLFLELKACYAYGKKKYREQRLEIGQSLVGQCYLEGEEIYLTEIPQNYTYITSGLGEATPDAIILIPLSFEEQVEGVLEIAAFGGFDDYERQFLNQMTQIIGSFLYNQRILNKNRSEAETAG